MNDQILINTFEDKSPQWRFVMAKTKRKAKKSSSVKKPVKNKSTY